MASVNFFNLLNHIDAISVHQVERVAPLLLSRAVLRNLEALSC